jgi:MFS family permease
MPVLGRSAGFILISYAFLVTMVGTTLPTPLYPLFEQRYHFGELIVTVVFAVYSFGVIAGLLVFGALSDELGRKPLLLLGLAFSALSAFLFLFAGSLAPIYAGRVVSGLSAGIFTGTATATLVDLAPGGRRRLGSLIAVVVNLGGLGCGTLLSGLLADYCRWPLRLPFALHLGLLVPAVLGVLLTPETVERTRVRLQLQRLSVPAEVRGVFIRGASAGFGSFAVAGVFSSVAPAFLGLVLGRTSHALAGFVVFALFTASISGQLVVPRLSDRRALVFGRADRQRGGGRCRARLRGRRRPGGDQSARPGRPARRDRVQLLRRHVRRSVGARDRRRRGRARFQPSVRRHCLQCRGRRARARRAGESPPPRLGAGCPSYSEANR